MLSQAIQSDGRDPTRFYKIKHGDYAEHDQFIGASVLFFAVFLDNLKTLTINISKS